MRNLLWAKKIINTADAIDSVIDALNEFRNSGSESDIIKSTEDLFRIRDSLYGISESIKAYPLPDGISIVRCKNCIYVGEFDENGYAICSSTGAGVKGTDFCSDGVAQNGGKVDAKG